MDRSGALFVVEVGGQNRELDLSSVTQLVGSDAYFDDLNDVLERFHTDADREPGGPSTSSR